MYPSMAATGHRSSPVAPIYMVIPLQNGSVFEALMRTSIHSGDDLLFTRAFVYDKCTSGSYPPDGATASPILRKPKKHRVDAAHSIAALCLSCMRDHTPLSCHKIAGVIGSQVRRCLPDVFLFSPFNTYSNCGIAPIWGSPRPMAICAWRIAAR